MNRYTAYEGMAERVALVDRLAYRRDIEKYESDVRIWNVTRKIFEPFTAICGIMAVFMITAEDETGMMSTRGIVAGCVFFAFAMIGSLVLANVKKPKFPKGVMLVDGEYVYTSPVIHPGTRTVIMGRTYVFDKTRPIKAFPVKEELISC